MNSRRGKQREEQVKIEEEKLQKRNPQAKDSMKDLMKEISNMSKQDWVSIPEAKNSKFKRVV
jgi:PRP1 splicing factor, N-terminal